MAIIRDDNEFKNKNVIPGGGASQLGGGYSSGGGSATGPQAGNVPKSSWTNIQEYLGNAGQGMETAQGMSGELETQGMDVQNGIQGWETDVGNQITGTTPQFGDTAYNDVASGKSTAAPGTYAGAGGITDPTKTAGYGDLLKGATEVTEKAKKFGDWSGIQGYLKGTVKGPYSQGMSNYDTLLAKTSGGDLMGRTKAKYGQTGNQLKTATSNLGTAIQGAQAASDAVNKRWTDATAANTAREKTISDTKAQEDALKNMNAGIAQQWVLPGKDTPVADMTKVNQGVANQNNVNAFTAQQQQAAAAAAAAAKAKSDADHKKRSTLSNPLKSAGGAISGGFKKLTKGIKI